MKIQLKRDPRAAFEEIEVEKGTTIETIYKRIEHELPYKIVAAKVNYKYEGLTYVLHRECRVELWICARRRQIWSIRAVCHCFI